MTYPEPNIIRTFIARNGLLGFVSYFFKVRFGRDFVIGRHHRLICNALDKVLRGETTRLIINIGPRFGKTEVAVKNFIAFALGINPAAKFIHLSYSADLVEDNSKEIMDFVRLPEYKALFPNVDLVSTSVKHWKTTAGGGVYAVASGGQVTGFGAGEVDEEKELEEAVTELDEYNTFNVKFGGAIVIDDPIKPDDAQSATLREKVNNKFESTIRNRVNSRKTPIIIIMQRLDSNDLCGYLEGLEPDKWEILKLPAMITDENGQERSLWPFKFTIEELHDMAHKNSFVYETQYMQNPVPREGLMYEMGFREYDIIPFSLHRVVKAYVDTADTGSDYLACFVYVETNTYNYILDVIYTQAPMETTEPMTANILDKYDVEVANIESNNGGRGFARKVDELLRAMGNGATRVKWFSQTRNKDSRIFNMSATVQNTCLFPRGWRDRWPLLYDVLTNYKKTGKNAHDDAPDALTGTVEFRPKTNRKSASKFF